MKPHSIWDTLNNLIIKDISTIKSTNYVDGLEFTKKNV